MVIIANAAAVTQRTAGQSEAVGHICITDCPAKEITNRSSEYWRRERVQKWIDGRIDWQNEDDQPRVQIRC